MDKIICFLTNEDGATAIEYAILVSLIAGVVVAAAAPVQQKTTDMFVNFDSAW